ncbi:unnamed protein product [Adineta steineri]|uniref:Uncharacterized protein n=1 Tax=Adineta steineri TaxID=433720 RepID=A0A816E3M6_9BILA|nr:unnamed protein product [Adineta steineri]CAF1643879.1 unnamed protein product [Adineta steineri]
MVQVWFRRNQHISSRINIDPDSNIDKLKQAIFGPADVGQYRTTYKNEILTPSAIVPQDTTDDMPIVFIKIESQELGCGGCSCAECHKCCDWHFIGNQNEWNCVCNYQNWGDTDWDDWCDGSILFEKFDGATCNYPLFPVHPDDRVIVKHTVPATVKRPYNIAVSRRDIDPYYHEEPRAEVVVYRVVYSAHVCLCMKH